MKQLVDYIPVLAFVGVYVFTDIYVATGALMVSAVVLLAVFRLKKWPISRQLWVIVWGALIFGGFTLVLQNKTFIQWKPTVFYWFVACAILASRYVGRGDYIQKALGKVLVLSDRAKTHLAWGWGVALLVAGGANLLVAYEFRRTGVGHLQADFSLRRAHSPHRRQRGLPCRDGAASR